MPATGAFPKGDGADARLVIRWHESGGPVGEMDGDCGKELIERGLAEQIGATGSVTLEEAGLDAEIVLALASGLVLTGSRGQ